ncbi:Cna B-type domain-containing protein [Streptococcus castoreus]|uniref:Cna B-type domain-containing protein n=1 Tax=Streptococcus castoreus TaxID=254786 RepID=UPI0006841C1C|nr:Cna B-type domain-containing protein [Streptococcus castoreus]
MNRIIKNLACIIVTFVILVISQAVSNVGSYSVYAQTDIVKDITVDKTEMNHSENFNVSVKFGGDNTKVMDGQREEISFSSDKVNITLPGGEIPLKNTNNVVLGTVSFSNQKAIVTFNKQASELHDIRGEFTFSVRGYYTGNFNENGMGSITLEHKNISKKVNVHFKKGGDSTDEIYSKKGVWTDSHKEGNRLDWIFRFNATQRATNQKAYTFSVEDQLPDTMEWDVKANQSKKYAVQLDGKWISLEQAKQQGISVEFDKQQLKISLNHKEGAPDFLDAKTLRVRLTAKVRDHIMNDVSVVQVENSSTPSLTGLDWKFDSSLFADAVKIVRKNGQANGTKIPTLKILKVLKGTKTPIQGVEFTIKKQNGSDIKLRQENGQYISQGMSIVLKTNENGVASVKGLETGDYILTETKAPDWIEFDENKPTTKEFTISKSKENDEEITVENTRKVTSVKVKKIWETANSENLLNIPSIKVRLYRNNEPILDEVELTSQKAEYVWTGLDLADTSGNKYVYTVKEVGEVNGSVKLGDIWYRVSYKGNMKDGFTITNRSEKQWTSMVSSTREIKVTKVWKNYDGNVENSPTEKIVVELYKDGVATGKMLELNKANNWSGRFKNLEVADKVDSTNYYKYTVKEVGESGNKIKYGGTWYKVTYDGNMKDGFTIKNEKERPSIPKKTKQPTSKNNLPKSGDESNLFMYVGLLLVLGSLIIGIKHGKNVK